MDISFDLTNDVFWTGDGGNLEQLAVPMVDVAGNCPAPSLAR